MSATNLTLAIEQGTTYRRLITWKAIDGSLHDLTGYHARLEIRSWTWLTVLLDLNDSAGLTLGGALGTIAVAMTATQTAGLGAGSARYDLIVTAPNGDVTRLLEGAVNIDPAVTVSS